MVVRPCETTAYKFLYITDNLRKSVATVMSHLFIPLLGSTSPWRVVAAHPGSLHPMWLWSCVFGSRTDKCYEEPACLDPGETSTGLFLTSPSSESSPSRYHKLTVHYTTRVRYVRTNTHSALFWVPPIIRMSELVNVHTHSVLTDWDSVWTKQISCVCGWPAAVLLSPQSDITHWHWHLMDQRQHHHHQSGLKQRT